MILISLFINLYPLYIMSSHAIEASFNRIIRDHDLNVICGSKRERTAVQRPPLPTFSQPSKPKSKSKKNNKSNSLTKITAQPLKQDQSKKKKTVIKKSNTQAKKKKEKKPVNQKSDESESVVIDQEIISSSQDQKQSQNILVNKGEERAEANKIQFPLPTKSRVSKKESENKQIQEPLIPSTKRQTKQKIVKAEQSRSESDENQRLENESVPVTKKTRGRPRKTKTKIQEPFTPLKQDQKDGQENKGVQIQTYIKRQIAIQKVILKAQEPQKMAEEPELSEGFEEPENMKYKRTRRAKVNTLIKYAEHEDEFNSDESFEVQKKKKKSYKINKYKNRYSKPYQINRIFRKEAKKNFPAFEVNVNLNKLSLQSFVRQFGVFDLIHFSLPIQFLYMFPEMPLLMQKGFIFVWAEQGQTQMGYHLMNRWGFDVIDQIIWIKANEEENKIEADNIDPAKTIVDSQDENAGNKELFINIKSTCLIGYKCPLGNKAEYRTKVSNNVIFARAQKGVKKPMEIYQIADLMMPGGKKLQFGGSAQKGWLNLRHHQKTLQKCHSCFKPENNYLILGPDQKVLKCKKCIIDDLKDQFDPENEVEAITQKFFQTEKIKIREVLYLPENTCLKCSRCHRAEEDLQYEGLIRQSEVDEELLCLKCFRVKLSDSKGQKYIDVLSKKKIFYNTAEVGCNSCGSEKIYDMYFESSKNKNQRLCKDCFWKTGETLAETAEASDKGPVSKGVNEWKLRFIKSSPLMKFGCFGCKAELSIPFWSCQTCQSWAWCGKCDRGSSQVHPHYQNDQHKEYLII